MIRASCYNGCNNTLQTRDVVVIHNTSHDLYTYAFSCTECGYRNVKPMNGSTVDNLITTGCRVMMTSDPRPSDCIGGPALTMDDVASFNRSLIANDYIAAYA